MYHRRDVAKWSFTTVGHLRRALAELPDDYEVYANGVGNLALCEPAMNSSGTHRTRWYVGYVDLATGQVLLKPGARDEANPPGAPEQIPWKCGSERIVESVSVSDFETNEPGDTA